MLSDSTRQGPNPSFVEGGQSSFHEANSTERNMKLLREYNCNAHKDKVMREHWIEKVLG